MHSESKNAPFNISDQDKFVISVFFGQYAKILIHFNDTFLEPTLVPWIFCVFLFNVVDFCSYHFLPFAFFAFWPSFSAFCFRGEAAA